MVNGIKNNIKEVKLHGKTLGIIGMGRIGKALAKKAEALGMKVVYYRIVGKQDNLAYEFLDFEEVL